LSWKSPFSAYSILGKNHFVVGGSLQFLAEAGQLDESMKEQNVKES
jgi:hypothetical protein